MRSYDFSFNLAITCQIPPRIKNGHWRYRTEQLFHKVVYSCDEPLVPSNSKHVRLAHLCALISGHSFFRPRNRRVQLHVEQTGECA